MVCVLLVVLLLCCSCEQLLGQVDWSQSVRDWLAPGASVSLRSNRGAELRRSRPRATRRSQRHAINDAVVSHISSRLPNVTHHTHPTQQQHKT